MTATMLLFVLVVGAGSSSASPSVAIAPDRQDTIAGLFEDRDRTLGAFRVARIAILGDRIDVDIRSDAGDVVARLQLLPRVEARADEATSRSFVIRTEVLGATAEVAAVTRLLTQRVIARDRGDIYSPIGADPVADPVAHAFTARDLQPWLVPFALLLPLLALPRSRAAPPELTRFKITHALPTAIQLTIFCYWAVYWTQLRSYAPWIVAQLAFAYFAEALAQWRRWGRWRPTTAPLPVTLSTNLFVQFGPLGGAWQLSAIAIALVSKEVLRRKGRHVFNPSAFGILVVGVVELLAFRTSSAGDPSFEFAFAPNMAEVLLLLALVVQLRVPVVLCTLGALVTMEVMLAIHPNANWFPVWAPVLLVLLLLITDPATSPRSALGKLFFGACVAIGMGLARFGLDTAGVSDFYGKLVGVVVANSLTDVFDRWAAAISQRWPRWVGLLDPRFNVIHVALTFALAASLMSGKRGVFLDPAQQESMRVEVVPGLVEGPGGSYRCEDNPAWCRPFSLFDELALDRARRSGDGRVPLPPRGG